jgi:hypothetical protein
MPNRHLAWAGTLPTQFGVSHDDLRKQMQVEDPIHV